MTTWKSEAGPRQTKAVEKAIGSLRWRGKARRVIYDSGPALIHQPMSAPNESAQLLEAEIGERYGWTITRDNCREIEAALTEAVERVEIPTDDERTTEAERAAAAERLAKARAEEEARQDRGEAMKAQILAKRPEWADALIVAEYDEDDSDSMTDYFNHKTTRRVAIGWRKGKRENFKRLREAAATFPATAHLGPEAGDDIEHRDNWSMGGGNYLKAASSQHATGWRVCSYGLTYAPWHYLEDHLPELGKVEAEAVAGAEIQKHHHSKHGFDFFLVVLADKVDRDTFEQLRERCKAAGGWYSRKWGKTPGGYAFREQADAEAFAAGLEQTAEQPAEPVDQRTKQAAKWRERADKLQDKIDHNTRPLTQNWTPKRGREYASRCHAGENQRRAQEAMRAIADALEAGTLPDCLLTVTRGQVFDWTATRGDSHGYYDYHDTYEPRDNSREAQALRELVERSRSPEDQAAAAEREQAQRIERLMDDVRGRDMPGFFPTPPSVIERMVAEADINEGERILEPSAGIGSIADYVRARWPDVTIHTCEVSPRLREILEAKGHQVVGHDFLEVQPTTYEDAQRLDQIGRYDRILMNPPFERGADCKHVRHAFDMLAPGGRLVAIMANGAAFRNGFADWLDSVGGWSEELPRDAFASAEAFRSTGVSTRLVVIDKEGPSVGPLGRMAAEQLAKEGSPEANREPGYWDSDPQDPVDDWKQEVANDDTREGYHSWLEARREERQMRLF